MEAHEIYKKINWDEYPQDAKNRLINFINRGNEYEDNLYLQRANRRAQRGNKLLPGVITQPMENPYKNIEFPCLAEDIGELSFHFTNVQVILLYLAKEGRPHLTAMINPVETTRGYSYIDENGIGQSVSKLDTEVISGKIGAVHNLMLKFRGTSSKEETFRNGMNVAKKAGGIGMGAARIAGGVVKKAGGILAKGIKAADEHNNSLFQSGNATGNDTMKAFRDHNDRLFSKRDNDGQK